MTPWKLPKMEREDPPGKEALDMKRKLLTLVEEEAYIALEALDLEGVGEEAAKDAVREYLGGLDLEDQAFQAVKEAMKEELDRGGAREAVTAALSDYVADIVGGWLR